VSPLRPVLLLTSFPGSLQSVAVCNWRSGAVLGRFVSHEHEVTKVSARQCGGVSSPTTDWDGSSSVAVCYLQSTHSALLG